MTTPLLSVRHLQVSFKVNQHYLAAIRDISFDILPGEIFTLLGESGCGKSLTALSILQLLPVNAYYHSNSQILFHGNDLLSNSQKQMLQIRGSKISIIFQEPMTSLNPVLTVAYQIGEVLIQHKKLTGKSLTNKIIELLVNVGIDDPDRLFAAYPHQLSGGQKQRVMIAMAIATEPDILIADEPTTALDVTIQAQILELLQSLQQKLGMSVLLITHDLGVVKQVASRVAVMYSGELMELADKTEFFKRPLHPYSRKLFAAIPSVKKRDQQLMEKTSHSIKPIIQVSDLRVYFPLKEGIKKKVVKAVDGVSFELYAGETVAVVGESGSGKTTVGRALMQLLPVTSGEIIFKGKNVSQYSTQQIKQLRKQMQIVFQDPFSSMNPRMLVGDIIMEGMKAYHLYPDFKARQQKVIELLHQVGLPEESVARYPHQFSGGQRQRICIARALAVEPEIIICDEPTSALDGSVQAQILNLLKQLQAELGLAYLFISHNISVVSYLADRIIVMYRGKIVESGETLTLLKNPQHPYTKQLLAAVLEV